MRFYLRNKQEADTFYLANDAPNLATGIAFAYVIRRLLSVSNIVPMPDHFIYSVQMPVTPRWDSLDSEHVEDRLQLFIAEMGSIIWENCVRNGGKIMRKRLLKKLYTPLPYGCLTALS